MRAHIAVLLALLLPPLAAAAGATVTVANFSFTPGTVALDPGDAVTWTWASGVHSVVETATGTVWCSVRTGGDCVRAVPAGGRFAYHCSVHPSMTGVVRVEDPQAADLAVASVGLSADGARVEVVVRNDGASASPASTVAVSYRSALPERALGTAAVPALAAGASVTVSVAWGSVKVGDFTLVARADPGDLLVEPDESDNRAEAGVTVLVGGAPGVAVPP
jgi:plastocyanin